jgi:hypothetical protein
VKSRMFFILPTIALSGLLLLVFSRGLPSNLTAASNGDLQENATPNISIQSVISRDAIGAPVFSLPSAVSPELPSGESQVVGAQAATPMALKDKYAAVEVEKFDVLQGLEFPTEYIQLLQDEIVKEFGNSAQFKQVLVAGQESADRSTSALRLSGTVTYLDKGSRAERYFGSGQGFIVIYVVFRDSSNGDTIITDQISATLSGGLFGGNSKNITREFAKALANITKLHMEKPAPSVGGLPTETIAGLPSAPESGQKVVTISASDYDQGQSMLNAQASAGYRLAGFTPKGYESADVMMEPPAAAPQAYQYRVLHVHLFGNLEKDLNKAAQEGYRYCPHTLSWLAGGFGGAAVAVIEKPPVPRDVIYAYRVHAANQLSNAQKDVAKDQRESFHLVGTLETPDRHIALMERTVSKNGK